MWSNTQRFALRFPKRLSHWFFLVMASVLLISGCAEGMFWKTGYLSPWVRQRWAEEEAIAATLFSKRTEMRDRVNAAVEAETAQREETSQYLSDIISNDPVLLLRIEAAKLLGDLPTKTSFGALQIASKDREVEVRRASVRSLERLGGDSAGRLLAQIAKNDADVDVRIAATAALAGYDTPLVRQTLAEVIKDPNPAMQLRAAESLTAITGQDFGYDIRAWQGYLEETLVDDSVDSPRTAEEDTDDDDPAIR